MTLLIHTPCVGESGIGNIGITPKLANLRFSVVYVWLILFCTTACVDVTERPLALRLTRFKDQTTPGSETGIQPDERRDASPIDMGSIDSAFSDAELTDGPLIDGFSDAAIADASGLMPPMQMVSLPTRHRWTFVVRSRGSL